MFSFNVLPCVTASKRPPLVLFVFHKYGGDGDSPACRFLVILMICLQFLLGLQDYSDSVRGGKLEKLEWLRKRQDD